jgi:hypothetical protein
MNKRVSIAMRADQEEKAILEVIANDHYTPNLDRRRFTKSRTGIDQPSPPKKSLSGTSSYMIGETYIKNAENEET